MRAEAAERFHRPSIHDFPTPMMQASAHISGTDVHSGRTQDGLSLKNGDTEALYSSAIIPQVKPMRASKQMN